MKIRYQLAYVNLNVCGFAKCHIRCQNVSSSFGLGNSLSQELSVLKLLDTFVSYLILSAPCGVEVPVFLLGLRCRWGGADQMVGCVPLCR